MKAGEYIYRIKAQRDAYKSAFNRVAGEMMRGGISAEVYAGIEADLLAALERLNEPRAASAVPVK